DEKGHYTAPKAAKTPEKVTVIATSVADPSKSAKVELTLAAVAVSAKVDKAQIPLGGEAQVNAEVKNAIGDASAVKFELKGSGAVDEKGHYTAPKAAKTPEKVTVVATSVADPSKSA